MIRITRLLAGTLALLLTACGDNPGPAISDADRKVAAEQHPKLLGEFGGSYDGKQAGYLARIGEKVAEAAGIGGKCKFTLVNTDVVNAFAVPGCYIYVTRGLMGIVNSEGELASVLAHELGHITGNHSYEQQRRSILSTLGVMAVEAITGSDQLARIAGAAAGFSNLSYSREHEYEADDLGLVYLRKAGYDPFASADMLDVLQRYQGFQDRAGGAEADAKSIPEWALTHPLTQNRIDRARETAEKTGLKPGALPEKEAEYLSQIDGLLYGDDPAQGFVLGRRFAHPEMRIAFEAPAGFTLTNSPQAVLIEGPDGLRGQFGGTRMPRGGLDEYAKGLLRNLLGKTQAEIVTSRKFDANGVPGLMVRASVATRQGAVPLSLAAYMGRDGNGYHFFAFSKPGSQPQPGITALFESFRLLNDADVAQLRPRMIRVAHVRAGDTAQRLAGEMAADRPGELLLMLNGRTTSNDVKPGDEVKLVVYPPR